MCFVQQLEVFLAFNETDEIHRTRAPTKLLIQIQVPVRMSPITLEQKSVFQWPGTESWATLQRQRKQKNTEFPHTSLGRKKLILFTISHNISEILQNSCQSFISVLHNETFSGLNSFSLTLSIDFQVYVSESYRLNP